MPRFLPTSLALFLGLVLLALSGCTSDAYKDHGTIADQDRRAEPVFQSAQAAEKDGSLRKAANLYEKIKDDAPGSKYAPEALRSYARIQVERKKYRKAFPALEMVVTNFPGYPEYGVVVKEEYDMATYMKDHPTRWFIVRFHDWTKVVEFYESIAKNSPFSPEAPEALRRLAEVHVKQGDPDLAIDALDRLVNIYPRNAFAPSAFLQIAQLYGSVSTGPNYDQGTNNRAQRYFEDYLALFPNAVSLSEAEKGLTISKEEQARSRYILGEYFWIYRKNRQSAKVFLNEAITFAPESNAAKDAKELLARIEATPPAAPLKKLSPLLESLAVWRPEKGEGFGDPSSSPRPENPKIGDTVAPAPAVATSSPEAAPPATTPSEPKKQGLGTRAANALFFWRKKTP